MYSQELKVKMALTVVDRITKNHCGAQNVLQTMDALRTVLYYKESKVETKYICTICDNIVENILKDKVQCSKSREYLNSLMFKQINEKKKHAEEKREQVLNKIKANNSQGISLNQDFFDMKEENGFKCVVCEEGYELNPAKMLGMQVQQKRMPQPESEDPQYVFNSTRVTQGVSTVSHA